jgi:hypothetical protein
MSWIRQVFHVARKDLMFGRWYFAAYAALIAMMVPLNFADGRDGTRIIVGLAYLLATLLVACLVTQNDSAMHVDAFWATRPLSPTAVLLAKVVAMAIGMTLPALVGQAVVLWRFGYRGQELVQFLGTAITGHLIIVVVVVMVAGMLPSLAAFAGVAILGLIALQFYGVLVGSGDRSVVSLPWLIGTLFQWLPVSLWVMALIHQYKTRNTGRSYRIAAGGVAVFAILPFVSASVVPPWHGTKSTDMPVLPGAASVGPGEHATVSGQLIPRNRIPGARLWIYGVRWISPGRPLSRGIVTRNASGSWALPPLPAGVHWIGDRGHQSESISLPDGGALNASAAGPLVVEGMMQTLRPTTVGFVPLANASRLVAKGFRAGFDSVGTSDERIVRVDYLWMSAMRSHPGAGTQDILEFTLVNRALGLAIPLHVSEGRGTGLAFPAGGANGEHEVDWLKLDPQRTHDHPGPVNPDWLRGAEVMVTRWDEAKVEPFRLRYETLERER